MSCVGKPEAATTSIAAITEERARGCPRRAASGEASTGGAASMVAMVGSGGRSGTMERLYHAGTLQRHRREAEAARGATGGPKTLDETAKSEYNAKT